MSLLTDAPFVDSQKRHETLKIKKRYEKDIKDLQTLSVRNGKINVFVLVRYNFREGK